MAEAWVLAGKKNIFDIKFLAARTIKQLQDQTCKKYKIKDYKHRSKQILIED